MFGKRQKQLAKDRKARDKALGRVVKDKQGIEKDLDMRKKREENELVKLVLAINNEAEKRFKELWTKNVIEAHRKNLHRVSVLTLILLKSSNLGK